MRKMLLVSVMTIGAAVAPAMAQTTAPATQTPMTRPGHVPGVGPSFPASNAASNITGGDTRSDIAPRLPAPAAGANGTARQYLMDAQTALQRHQTGAAQEALERAETFWLDRSVPQGTGSMPDQGTRVTQVQNALRMLGRKDYAGTQAAISQLLAMPEG